LRIVHRPGLGSLSRLADVTIGSATASAPPLTLSPLGLVRHRTEIPVSGR